MHYGNPFAPIQSLFTAVLQTKPVSARAAGKLYKIFFDRALNRPRSPEVRKPLVYFWFFSYKRKARKTFLSQEVPRFRKPQTSTPQPQLRAATIKTFFRKLRGFANLESAYKNNNCARTNLNPFAALWQCPCRDGTLRVLLLPPLAALSLLQMQQSLAAKPP